MDRELDKQVASILGWTDIREHHGNLIGCPPGNVQRRPYPHTVPSYSIDVAATFDMEDVIRERGLHQGYAQAMMVVFIEDDLVPERDEEFWWQLLHATPEQRCRAWIFLSERIKIREANLAEWMEGRDDG